MNSLNSSLRVLSVAGLLALIAIAMGTVLASCASLAPPRTAAEALYRKRCGNCHELYAPHEHSSADWRRVMTQMSTNAGLSDAQTAELLEYLTANARNP